MTGGLVFRSAVIFLLVSPRVTLYLHQIAVDLTPNERDKRLDATTHLLGQSAFHIHIVLCLGRALKTIRIMSSTTSTDHISVAYELAPDLSGRVSKEEDYYFDHGGSADIWKGKWQKTSESSQLVSNYFIYIDHRPYVNLIGRIEGNEGPG